MGEEHRIDLAERNRQLGETRCDAAAGIEQELLAAHGH